MPEEPAQIWQIPEKMLPLSNELSADLDPMLKLNAPWKCISFSSDSRIICTTIENNLKIWDVFTGVKIKQIESSSKISGLAFTLDSQQLITGNEDGSIFVWDVVRGEKVREIKVCSSSVRDLALSPSGQLIGLTSTDGYAYLVELASGNQVWHSESGVGDLEFSTDQKLIVVQGKDFVRFLDVASGNVLRNIKKSARCAISSSGGLVCRSSFDETKRSQFIESASLTLFGLEEQQQEKCIWKSDFPGGSLVNLVFSPDDRFIFAISNDSDVRVFDVKTGKEICLFPDESENRVGVNWLPLSISSNGKIIAVQRSNRPLELWDLSRLEKLIELRRKIPDSWSMDQWGGSFKSTDNRNVAEWFALKNDPITAIKYFLRTRSEGLDFHPIDLGRCYWKINRIREAIPEFESELERVQKEDVPKDITMEANQEREKLYLRLCIQALTRQPPSAK